jgi:hypothetical protein
MRRATVWESVVGRLGVLAERWTRGDWWTSTVWSTSHAGRRFRLESHIRTGTPAVESSRWILVDHTGHERCNQSQRTVWTAGKVAASSVYDRKGRC